MASTVATRPPSTRLPRPELFYLRYSTCPYAGSRCDWLVGEYKRHVHVCLLLVVCLPLLCIMGLRQLLSAIRAYILAFPIRVANSASLRSPTNLPPPTAGIWTRRYRLVVFMVGEVWLATDCLIICDVLVGKVGSDPTPNLKWIPRPLSTHALSRCHFRGAFHTSLEGDPCEISSPTNTPRKKPQVET